MTVDGMAFPWALWLCRVAQTSAAVLLAGTATLRLLAWDTGAAGLPRWHRLAWGSGCVLLGAAVLQLGLTATEMSGQSLARVVADGTLAEVLGGTRFGRVWLVRTGLLAGALVAGLVAGAKPGRGLRAGASVMMDFTGAALAAALLASLVWDGHAHASDRHGWLLPVDVAHAVAAGAWPGGLLPLGLLLARARREPDLILPAVTVTRRFSRLSMAVVGTLALTGLLNGVGLVGTSAAAWWSPYGGLILCKAALLAGMVGLGAVNRRRIRQAVPGDAEQTLRCLWRNVAWECVLMLGVLLATEGLAMSAPPASAG